MSRFTGTAPGRIDLLGGVADYSGSLVLQTPTTAVTVAVLSPRSGDEMRFVWKEEIGQVEFVLPCTALTEVRPGELETFAELLEAYHAPKPARFLAGCCFAAAMPPSAFDVEIHSDVPESMGVSSSAALEVAMLRALASAGLWGGADLEMARLAQQVENRIVGAPCGIMDQIASVFGLPGALLPILCRPDEVREPVPLPEGVVAVGWPSGVKHDVGGSPYQVARTAAFMGKRVIEQRTGATWAFTSEIPKEVAEEAALPETLLGSQFQADFGQLDDPLSRIEPALEYPVRSATLFPIHENLRSEKALELLRAGEPIHEIGSLLYAAHEGYTAMGLGAPETDRMVAAFREVGPKRGFHGARISGGGAGGTVAALISLDAIPELQQLSARLTSGHPLIF